MNIKNLNKTQANHKYADIYAEKNGVRYVISVKTRNKYTANGRLNPAYNLIKGGDAEFAKEAEDAKEAKAAWVAVALEDATFDAYFGLLSSLASAKSIPMTPRATENYLCLAQGMSHDEDPLEFKNQYQMNNAPVNLLSLSTSPSVPTEDERRQAKEASRLLAVHLLSHPSLTVQLARGDQPDEVIELPAIASRLLLDILMQTGQGDAVTITPVSTELTIREAADILKVSNAYLIGLLTEGQIPFRTVGTQRYILRTDLMDYKQRDDEVRHAALGELAAQAQELDMGY